MTTAGTCRRTRTVLQALAAGAVFASLCAWGQSSGRIERNAAPARPVAEPPRAAAPAPDRAPAAMPVPDPDERDISVLIVAGEETTLSSQMPGKVSRVNGSLGENVRAGATLVEFDCSEQVAQLQTAEAEYRGARETHLTKLRLQALGAAGELEVTVAAAAADKAKSQVTFRESQIAYCKVPAPFSGRIAKLRVKQAESVSLGQPLLDLVNPGALKAQLYVPAAWIRWIKPGTPFTVRTEDNARTYKARVSRINARVEGVSQSLEIEGRIEGSAQWLLPGMVGTADFPGRKRN